MARYQVSFDVEGDTQVISMFESARSRAINMRTPFRYIGEMMHGYIDRNFASRGGVWGRWKRRRRAYSWPLLEKTGEMRSGFDDKVGRNYVEISNRTHQFKFHQSKKPRSSNLPRRIMMAIEEDQRRDAMKILQEHVMGGK